MNVGLLGYVITNYKKSQLGGSFFAKPKAWILMLGIAIYTLEFIRNFFALPTFYSLGSLYAIMMIQFVVYLLVVMFFVKAASKLVGKERAKQWDRNFRYFEIASGVVLFINFVLIVTSLVNETFGSDKRAAECAG